MKKNISESLIKKFESKIKNSSWNEVHRYILPEIRYMTGDEWETGEKTISKEQYERLINLIMKVHNKEEYEL